MTRRELIEWTSTVFDLRGLTGPLTIRLRPVLQETLTPNIMSRLADLVSLIKEMGKFQTLSISRYYFKDSSPAAVQLHLFNDASEEAIANVA